MDEERRKALFKQIKEYAVDNPGQGDPSSLDEMFIGITKIVINGHIKLLEPPVGLQYIFSVILKHTLKHMWHIEIDPGDHIVSHAPVNDGDRANMDLLQRYFENTQSPSLDETFEILCANGQRPQPANPFARAGVASSPQSPFARKDATSQAQEQQTSATVPQKQQQQSSATVPQKQKQQPSATMSRAQQQQPSAAVPQAPKPHGSLDNSRWSTVGAKGRPQGKDKGKGKYQVPAMTGKMDYVPDQDIEQYPGLAPFVAPDLCSAPQEMRTPLNQTPPSAVAAGSQLCAFIDVFGRTSFEYPYYRAMRWDENIKPVREALCRTLRVHMTKTNQNPPTIVLSRHVSSQKGESNVPPAMGSDNALYAADSYFRDWYVEIDKTGKIPDLATFIHNRIFDDMLELQRSRLSTSPQRLGSAREDKLQPAPQVTSAHTYYIAPHTSRTPSISNKAKHSDKAGKRASST